MKFQKKGLNRPTLMYIVHKLWHFWTHWWRHKNLSYEIWGILKFYSLSPPFSPLSSHTQLPGGQKFSKITQKGPQKISICRGILVAERPPILPKSGQNILFYNFQFFQGQFRHKVNLCVLNLVSIWNISFQNTFKNTSMTMQNCSIFNTIFFSNWPRNLHEAWQRCSLICFLYAILRIINENVL